MNHLSQEISKLGKEQVKNHFGNRIVQKGRDLIIDGKYLVSVNTKAHITYPETGDIKLTGKDPDKIKKLREKLVKLNLSDVYMLFVDVKLKQCYGHYLSNLDEELHFEDFYFPHQRLTHSDRIEYWSVIHMPTLFHLTDEFCQAVIKLRFKNKHDKNQLTIE